MSEEFGEEGFGGGCAVGVVADDVVVCAFDVEFSFEELERLVGMFGVELFLDVGVLGFELLEDFEVAGVCFFEFDV